MEEAIVFLAMILLLLLHVAALSGGPAPQLGLSEHAGGRGIAPVSAYSALGTQASTLGSRLLRALTERPGTLPAWVQVIDAHRSRSSARSPRARPRLMYHMVAGAQNVGAAAPDGARDRLCLNSRARP
jgi:hypothetical protein